MLILKPKFMKQKILAISSVLLIAFSLLIVSCSKEGKTGPAGQAGTTGPQGNPGPAGNPGATGAPGTANVIYSPWLNLTFQGNYTTGWIAQIAATKLVDSILNKGEIKVYFNAGSDSTGSQFILALPIDDAFLIGAIIDPYYQPQQITIASTTDVSSFTDNGNHYFQFRYILIPGGTTALPVGPNGNNGINWNDYNQVKKYLGLKD